jgi:molecular chaperone IbpA
MNAWTYKTAIGFDKILDEMLEVVNHKTSNYPPYNLYKTEDQYVIEVAVAGFAEDDLDIEVADNKLTISGDRKVKTSPDGEESPTYLHAGLAFRSFKRVFTINDNIQIGEATLENGVLTLYLDVVVPEEKKPRKVKINV